METYLDTTVAENLKNFHPTRHQYQSPSMLTQTPTTGADTTEQASNIQQLQARLRARQLTTKPLQEAPQNRSRNKTYANTVTCKVSPTQRTTENPEMNTEIKALKEQIEKQNISIKQITTHARTIATSSLTPETNMTEAIKQITAQQNEQFRKMMNEMMQSVFQQMFQLIQTVLHQRGSDMSQGGSYNGYGSVRPMNPGTPPGPPLPIMMATPTGGPNEQAPMTMMHIPNHPSTVVETA